MRFLVAEWSINFIILGATKFWSQIHLFVLFMDNDRCHNQIGVEAYQKGILIRVMLF